MSNFDHQWQRLTTLARQAPADRDVAVPAGFATRVAAQAGTLPAGARWLPLERYALRGLALAAVCGAAAVAFNFTILTAEESDAYATDLSDPVELMLDLS